MDMENCPIVRYALSMANLKAKANSKCWSNSKKRNKDPTLTHDSFFEIIVQSFVLEFWDKNATFFSPSLPISKFYDV